MKNKDSGQSLLFHAHHRQCAAATFGRKLGGLSAEEESDVASFSRRLIEIAALTCASGSGRYAIEVLNKMCLPAIGLDQSGFIVNANTAAEALFDDNIRVKDNRLLVRDLEARALLKASLGELGNAANLKDVIFEPIVIQRISDLPVIARIWPLSGAVPTPKQDIHVIITMNALGPKSGPPAAILAKAFRLTPSEAKLACIIARGASPAVAAKELKIAHETVRNQLKTIFAKTNTHRQSELVALLLQVQ